MSGNPDTSLSDTPTRVHLRWLAPNAVRIIHTSPDETLPPPDRPWLEQVLLPSAAPKPNEIELRLSLHNGCVQASTGSGAEFFHEAHPPRLGLKRRRPYLSLDIPKTEVRFGVRRVEDGVSLCFATQPDEAFYGWGEWFNAFRRHSGSLQLRIRDAIAMLQDRATYSAIPLYFSSRGYALWLLNSHPSRWDIDPRRGILQVEADGPGADYILIYGPDFKRILRTYTALTGRPPLLPRWAFGLWVTSYPQGHQDGVLAHVRQHRQRHIPLDAVILDYHWEQAFHNFRWRAALFPQPERLIAGLQELGMRLGLIITPFLNQRSRPFQKRFLKTLAHNIPPGAEQDDERALPEYEQACAQGYLAHENANWWFGAGGMPDFANPPAAAWWNQLMHPLYEQGVAFFKNDDGEYLPEDAHSAIGMDGREYHNLYGFFYGKALYEGLAAAAPISRRSLIYARSVWAGSQRYPALFLGDQKPTYAGIRSTLRAGLNLGLLGFAYWTADVFGLDGKTTPELHMRYAQWALMVPVARYFWRPPEIDNTRFPWSHGPVAEANFRKYTELRYRLLPYSMYSAWQAYQTGLPILRPLVLEFPDQPALAGIDDQVMLGECLMLCPVVEAGAVSRKIVLPAGTWHDFWSAQTWQGPAEIDYPAPLDRLPLLVRGGSILPLGPVMQHIPDDHRLDHLQLHVWPPYPAEGWLYDDDGCTTAYQQGAYSLTRLSAEENEGHVQIHIAAAQGGFPEQVEARQVEVVVHRSAASQGAGTEIKAKADQFYDADIGTFIQSKECATKDETVIEIF